jgi:hypothetical protein
MQVELSEKNFDDLVLYIGKSKRIAPGYDVSITKLANYLLTEKLAVELKRIGKHKP